MPILHFLLVAFGILLATVNTAKEGDTTSFYSLDPRGRAPAAKMCPEPPTGLQKSQ